MDSSSVGMTIRRSLDERLIQMYLKFAPPTSAPNLLDLLPTKYQYADSAGYLEVATAYDLEYVQNRPQDSVEFYESACRLGHPLANYCYGLWFLGGDRPTITTTGKIDDNGGDGGDFVEEEEEVGGGKNKNKNKKDLREAFRRFCAAHKRGFGLATFQLADFYRTGKGKLVERDARKAFAFLLESVSDPRTHWLLEEGPFRLLGLAYGLGRGTPPPPPGAAVGQQQQSAISITDAARCFERASHYAAYHHLLIFSGGSGSAAGNSSDEAAGNYSGYGKSDPAAEELAHLHQFAALAVQLDADETKRNVQIRLRAMETYMSQLPPARTMRTLGEFAELAKTKFGLDYQHYLVTVANNNNNHSKKEATRRMTWKSFRRQTDGRAKLDYRYEMQSEVERWPPIVPVLRDQQENDELRKYLDDLQVRVSSSKVEPLNNEDYGFHTINSLYDYGDEDYAEENSAGGSAIFSGNNDESGTSRLDFASQLLPTNLTEDDLGLFGKLLSDNTNNADGATTTTVAIESDLPPVIANINRAGGDASTSNGETGEKLLLNTNIPEAK